MANPMTVEDAPRQAEDRLAMLRYLTDRAAGHTYDAPPREVFSGLADAIGEAEELVHAIRKSLDVEALAVNVKHPR